MMIDAFVSAKMQRVLLFVSLGVSALSSARAGVVYDSLSSVPVENVTGGAVWPGAYFGDAITLSANSAVLNELKFQAMPFFSGYSSSFTAYFYGLDAGPDGLFQTGDDKFGSLLGSSSAHPYTFTSSDVLQTVSLTGFSVAVPKNFIWVVNNDSIYNDLQVGAVRSAGYATVTGGSSSLTTGVWFQNSTPAPGSSMVFLNTTGSHSFEFDFAVQLNDAAGVPEIDPRGLGSVVALIMGAVGIAERRQRRARSLQAVQG